MAKKQSNKAAKKRASKILAVRGEAATNKTADVAYRQIAEILQAARATAYRAVNQAMVQAYWEIGRVIVEQEQKGRRRAGYGEELLVELAGRLTAKFGKGFDERNLRHIRQFLPDFSNLERSAFQIELDALSLATSCRKRKRPRLLP